MDNMEKKATPGKIALAVAAVVLLAAALIGIVVMGLNGTDTDVAVTEAVETAAVTEATIPADGNPEDETAKGSYTASDEEVKAQADTVVATVGEYQLTNGQLQVYYWMEVQSFLSTYGSYVPYFGLDVSQDLDTQICAFASNGETWQQFFLAGALNTWRNHQATAAEAEKAGFVLSPELQAELDGTLDTMEQNAAMYGLDSAEALLAANVGGGASMEDYLQFMQLYYPGSMYFTELVEAEEFTEEDVEAYFTENEQAYLESGLAREDRYVDVRHVLIMPEGADSSNIRTETFDEAAWESAKVKAEELMASWEAGDKSEESFAQLAMDHSQDGSAANGGLYTDVVKGQMVEAFENWCFAEDRAYGDYGIVETEFGYHLMFFVGSRPVWPEYAESDLRNQYANQLLDEIVAQYPLEADFEKMLLAYVDLDGETADTNAVEEEKPLIGEKEIPALVIAGVSVVLLAAAAIVFKKKEHE